MILHNSIFNPADYPSTSGEAIDFIIESNSPESMFLIVPTGKIVRHLNYELIRKYYSKYGKPFSGSCIFTFQSFVNYCCDRIFHNRNFHLFSDAFRLALFEEASQKADLKFFKPLDKSMSFALLERLSQVIMGLKEDGILPGHIKQNMDLALNDKKSFKTDIKRMTDMYALYSAYNDLLDDKILDFPDLLRIITAQVKDNPDLLNSIFHNGQIAIMYGFTDFKQPEIDFLSLFSKCSVPFVINVEYDEINGPLFTILEESINKLTSSGFTITAKEKEITANARFDYLKKNLFDIANERTDSFSDIIRIIEAPTIKEEVNYVTKLIKYLILVEGHQPSDICIALRQPDKYSELFREAFFVNKMPVNISDRFQLDKSPVVSAIFAILDILKGGYRIETLRKALKNPYINFSDSEKVIDADNLLSCIVKLKITRMKSYDSGEYWHNSIQKKIEMLQAKINLLDADPMSDDFEKRTLKADYSFFIKALEDFDYVRSIMPKVKRNLNGMEFSDFLNKEIINRFGIKENIKKRVNITDFKSGSLSKQDKILILENIEKDSRGLNALLNILDEMEYILSERSSNKDYTFSDMYHRLKTSIAGQKYQINEKSGFGVTVTSIEQTRQLPFKIMFLCGAIDGEFPSMYRPETFLGMELPDTERKHILKERMQFFQFITNSVEHLESGEKRIFISYPKFNEEKELVRSQFVDSLLSITTLEHDKCIINIATELTGKDQNKYPWIYAITSNFDEQECYARTKIDVNNNTTDSELLKNDDFQKELIDDYIDFRSKRNYSDVKIEIENLPSDIKDYFANLSTKAYSVTELEDYAKCPYYYFLSRILRLKKEEEFELSISSQDIGNILHRVLFEFYSTIATEQYPDTNRSAIIPIGSGLQPIKPVFLDNTEKQRYLDLLISIAEKHLQQIKYEHPLFEIDTESILGGDFKPGILKIWLNNELGRIGLNWIAKPCLFEFAFGMKSYNSQNSPEIEIDGLKLKGKIDRLEINLDENLFMIADYKLSGGSLPSINKVVAGKSFQIPLYLLAAKKILLGNYGLDLEPLTGIYYIFKNKNDEKSHKPLMYSNSHKLFPNDKSRTQIKGPDDMNNKLDSSLSAAKQIVEKIGNGYFSVEPDSNACTYCDFASICRINKA